MGKGKVKEKENFIKGIPQILILKEKENFIKGIPQILILKEKENFIKGIPRIPPSHKRKGKTSLREFPHLLNYPRPFLLESGHFQFYISKPSLSFIKSVISPYPESSKILKPR